VGPSWRMWRDEIFLMSFVVKWPYSKPCAITIMFCFEWICIDRPSQTQTVHKFLALISYVCLLQLAISTHDNFAKNVANSIFLFNSWLSFQWQCRMGITTLCISPVECSQCTENNLENQMMHVTKVLVILAQGILDKFHSSLPISPTECRYSRPSHGSFKKSMSTITLLQHL